MFILKNNINLILIFSLINLSLIMLFTDYNIRYEIIFLILFFVFTISLYDFKKDLTAKKAENLIKQNKEYKKRIKKIYTDYFKPTDFKDIFDQKIFTIIEMLTELTQKNISGVFGGRVHSIINESLRIYIINLESASKMIQASKVDLDFKEDIDLLMEQNKIIISNLKDFISKLIRLDVNDTAFVNLIDQFSKSIKNLDSIKEIRKGN